eukprot:scpid63154/ scgid20834/ Endoplasmic reticulum-Golgi intermediate compartment protein 2
MRRLTKRQPLEVVKELDAFPKIPESYVETSSSGGGVSIFIFACIAILVVAEIYQYRSSELRYQYSVDSDMNSKLQINADITVAMQCDYIGADVLDVAGSSIPLGTDLLLTPSYFELSKAQKKWRKHILELKGVKMNYQSLNTLVTDSPKRLNLPDNPVEDDRQPDACRIHGSFHVNKVEGNFHVTVGKSIPHMRGHTHLSAFIDSKDYNFSHRIDKLSFGPEVPGLINPLDAEYQTTEANYFIYQYFIQIVPTEFATRQQKLNTNQFSFTNQKRELNHVTGSHGVPGIFFKYDLSPVKVHIREVEHPVVGLFVKLCGIIGGIFATSGILHGLVSFLFSCFHSKSESSMSEEDQLKAKAERLAAEAGGN